MEARAAGIRDVSLLLVATALGVFLSPAIPFVGLPVAAIGLASLAYRGNALAAAISAAVGVAFVALVSPPDLAYAAPAVVAILLAVVLLPKWKTQAVGALVIGILTAAGIASAAVLAWVEKTTLTASVIATTQSVVADLIKALGTSATPDVVARLKGVTSVMVAAWPWTYFESAAFAGVLVIASVSFAARRVGRTLDVPPLGALDLTPHVLWAFVVGVLLLAVSRASFAGSSALWVVGLNLALCARTLFFLQGLGVSAGVLDRAGVGLGRRILALAALAVLDSVTFVLSFIGLLDFWVNFRRLPREGGAPVSPSDSAERRY